MARVSSTVHRQSWEGRYFTLNGVVVWSVGQYVRYLITGDTSELSGTSSSFYGAAGHAQGRLRRSRHVLYLSAPVWAFLGVICLRLAKVCSDAYLLKKIQLTPDEQDVRSSVLYAWALLLKKFGSNTDELLYEAEYCAAEGFRLADNDGTRAMNAMNLLRISQALCLKEKAKAWHDILLDLASCVEPKKAVRIERTLADYADWIGDPKGKEGHLANARRIATQNNLPGQKIKID